MTPVHLVQMTSWTRGQVAVMLDRFRKEILGESETVSSSSRRRTVSSSSTQSTSSSTTVTTGSGPGTLRFAKNSYTVSEDAGTVVIEVIRDGGSDGSVAVRFNLSEASATAGNDYDITNGTLRFSDGETSKTFSIRINDDSKTEGPETLNLTLSEVSGGASIGKSIVVLTIDDDESPSTGGGNSSTTTNPDAGSFMFTAHKYEVMEDTNNATITVKRINGSSGTVTVEYATTDGTGDGNNYSSAQGTLTFNSGETEKGFDIAIFDSDNITGNKSVNITLSAPTGGAFLSAPSKSLLTIIDKEIATTGTGTIKFSSSSYSVDEGDGIAIIKVTRSNGRTGTVSVQYSTSNGTATAGSDYTATSGTLTFVPGESEKSFTVDIKEDSISDASENVNISLTNPTAGATLATPSVASLTIE